MSKRKPMSKTAAHRLQMTVIYLILGLCAIICIFPFLWMVTTAFKSTAEAYQFPPTLLPKNGCFLISQTVCSRLILDYLSEILYFWY